MPSRLPLYAQAYSPLVYGDALAGWFDGADQGTYSFGTGVSQWRDKGARGQHQAQATGASQPTLVAVLNGKPGLRFVSQSLFGPFALSGTAVTVFVVARLQTTASSNGRLLCFAETGVADTGAGGLIPLRRTAGGQAVSVVNVGQLTDFAVTYGTAFLHGTVIGGGVASSRLNGGAAVEIASSPTFVSTRCAIGTGLGTTNPSSVFWQDDLHEVVIIKAALTESERVREEGRLSHKWFNAANLSSNHAWKSACP